ncbi:MAG: Ni/Fe hydrogenase subunit alpha [Isosphaeraceae bacterium]|nr:Ni/Fe hydrogenase subunit alpha [Isosphaeraceae bacterium]
MTRRIVIDPVTRIEGHAKITIHFDDDGRLADARFHVTEFRGFEKFCEGRPFWEMPGITARVCGICPVSHLMASAKAGDEILAVEIPPSADKLRRLMNLAQIVQSHALSFFHMSAPDLLLGFDADPATRNLFGLVAAEPDLARRGIRLRQFGQEIIEHLGGKKIHPDWAVPGGVGKPLTPESRAAIAAKVDEAKTTAIIALERFKPLLDVYADERDNFGDFPSLFLGLVGPDGAWENYGGKLRFVDHDGTIVADQIPASEYRDHIAEVVQPDSYLKSPYYRPRGPVDGVYRVGPLARLNVCSHFGVPLADRELAEYRDRGGRTPSSSFWYHYARLIEILAGVEMIERLLDDPDLLDHHPRSHAQVNRLEGVGVSEAPRGTLFHHYRVDRDGILQNVNLIIATGQNNLAMNRTMLQIARRWIPDFRPVPEGVLNRLEAGIRSFDPCLSCSTHAVGTMPLIVQLVASDGTTLSEVRRD